MDVLVTGGAGFIGSNLTRRLLKEGCRVTVLDNFSPQIHGGIEELAADIKGDVRLVKGDVRDGNVLRTALANQDAVVHLAAETGTGQSMYELVRYESVNIGGTTLLMDLIINDQARSIQKIVVASSRAIYGEGAYRCAEHGRVFPGTRSSARMDKRDFGLYCPKCGKSCCVIPTEEDSPFQPSSFYGLTKQLQEQMVIMMAAAKGIDAAALRYQNVYGPGQSLQNPYTGILAIFSNLAKSGSPINIFEDGEESRDFVFIDDVVNATWCCLSQELKGAHTLNVGSGQLTTVLEVVDAIRQFWHSDSEISISGQYRVGDIRHNYADLKKINQLTGFTSSISFDHGIQSFLTWASDQTATGSGYQRSLDELKARGLFRG
jgi:dTDP-L-rhamnose 4-epimerase